MTATSFLLLLACLLIAAKIAGWLSQALRLPAVLGQLVVGVIAGPSFLQWIQPGTLFDTFANLGVILLMFVAGLETDMQQMRKVGGASFLSALLGVVVPFIAGMAFAWFLGYGLPASLFMGTLLTATSVSISAQTLKDLGKLRTKTGTTILGAAIIDDVLGLIVLSVILAFTLGQNPAWALLKMFIYLPVAYIIGHYAFPLLSRWLPRMLALEARIGFIFAFVLLYAWSAQELGNIAAITGAYVAGVLVSRTEMREWVHDGISKLGYSLFVPLFFVSVGLAANIHSLGQTSIWLIVGVVGIAIGAKIVGCGGGALLCRFSSHESLAVGVGMVSRGEVALVTATIGLNAGLIDSSLFSLAIIVTLVTTLITPLLLKVVYSLPAASTSESNSALLAVLNEPSVAIQEESHV